MAAEYYIKFDNNNWLDANRTIFADAVMKLPTFVRHDGNEFWLKGVENRTYKEAWPFDVRLFTENHDYIFMELSSHPPSIEADLKTLFDSLRAKTKINIRDEDGEESNW